MALRPMKILTYPFRKLSNALLFLVEKAFLTLDIILYLVRAFLRNLVAPFALFNRSKRFVSLSNRLHCCNIGRPLMAATQQVKWRAEDGVPEVHWKGVQNLKDPFSLCTYPLLLWELRPKTVIELGSFKGGSAVWMADTMDNFGIDGHIYSYDIQPERVEIEHPRVTFDKADTGDLSTLDREMLAALPHPWLVIEDAHHNVYEVLKYFGAMMEAGDYLIVEDAADAKYTAMEKFVGEHEDEYLVDTKYTDMFGYNATWHMNGFLKKVK